MRASLTTHHSALSTALSSLVGISLMVFALWIWRHSTGVADGWIGYDDSFRPDAARWAVRCGAIAIAAVAQGMFVVAVLGRLYQRQLLDLVIKLGLAAVFVIAVISAIALGLAAR